MSISIGRIKDVLTSALRALDDASSVVDPGDDEKVAYEREIAYINDLLKELENEKTV